MIIIKKHDKQSGNKENNTGKKAGVRYKTQITKTDTDKDVVMDKYGCRKKQ